MRTGLDVEVLFLIASASLRAMSRRQLVEGRDLMRSMATNAQDARSRTEYTAAAEVFDDERRRRYS